MTELRTLKDLIEKSVEKEHSTTNIISKIETQFAETLRDKAIRWIRMYESTNMVCHQWMSNALRHFLNIDRKGTPYVSQKFEKKFAIMQIKKIKKDFNLTEEDLK